jgi:predicted metal-dependent hydrolase
MAVKAFQVPEIGVVHVYKRRGSKQIRLSVTSDGIVRVIMPLWAPYRAGITFARQKQAWIATQQLKRPEPLKNGQRVGKFHTLQLVPEPSDKIRTRLKETEAILYYPSHLETVSTQVQKAAHNLIGRALKQEGEKLLPQRVSNLADKFGLNHSTITVRHLKTRWGSCNAKKELTFNYFLMQLPWELIDYVILHELAHTKQLNHSPEFWAVVEGMVPDYQVRKKQLRDYQPSMS